MQRWVLNPSPKCRQLESNELLLHSSYVTVTTDQIDAVTHTHRTFERIFKRSSLTATDYMIWAQKCDTPWNFGTQCKDFKNTLASEFIPSFLLEYATKKYGSIVPLDPVLSTTTPPPSPAGAVLKLSQSKRRHKHRQQQQRQHHQQQPTTNQSPQQQQQQQQQHQQQQQQQQQAATNTTYNKYKYKYK